jgi:LysR family glycine cleavage system transcriptional activator
MKRDRLPPLEWIRAFEAAARLGSFTAAAEDVGLTQAAVSQRIGQLEKHLGTPLFHRRARAISLTVEGEAWLPHVRLALEGLRDSTEAVFGTGHRRLTLSASQTIIDLWLLPRLGRLQTLTKAEISIQSMVVGAHDAPQDDVIRIRYGTGDWPHPYRARLYAEEISPVAAPVSGGPRRALDGVAAHRLRRSATRLACLGSRVRHPDHAIARPALRHTSVGTWRGQGGAGRFAGIAAFVRGGLGTGALVRLDPASLSHHESYWLLASPQAVSRDQWQAITTAIIDI